MPGGGVWGLGPGQVGAGAAAGGARGEGLRGRCRASTAPVQPGWAPGRPFWGASLPAGAAVGAGNKRRRGGARQKKGLNASGGPVREDLLSADYPYFHEMLCTFDRNPKASAQTRPRRSQFTDDTELALCLGHALAASDAASDAAPPAPASDPAAAAAPPLLPLDEVARWYGLWLASPPFDIGAGARPPLCGPWLRGFVWGGRPGSRRRASLSRRRAD